MSELIHGMLDRLPEAVRARDSSGVSKEHDRVVVLRGAVLEYLQQLARRPLTDAEADEHGRLVYAASEIESISSAVGRELAPMAETFRDAGISASDATRDLFDRLWDATQKAARAGLSAIVEKDERAAQDVVARRRELWALGNELLEQQASRLAEDDAQRLLKHRLQVDVLDKLRRIYSVAEHMAISVLPRGALASELEA